MNKSPELNKLEDLELVRLAADGDEPAFEELYWRHHRRVYAVCFRMTRDESSAEDVTQQVFLNLFRKLKSFRGIPRSPPGCTAWR